MYRSGFYPGIHYLLGSWYTPRELGKRAMIFWLAGTAGQMFSGFLQAAAYKTLNGVHGHAGWQWLFIIGMSPLTRQNQAYRADYQTQSSPSRSLSPDTFSTQICHCKARNVGGLPKRSLPSREVVCRMSIGQAKSLGPGQKSENSDRAGTLGFFVSGLAAIRSKLTLAAILYVLWNNGYPQVYFSTRLK